MVLERRIQDTLPCHQSQQREKGAFLQECSRQPPRQQKDVLQKVMFRSHFTSPQGYRMRTSASSWAVPNHLGFLPLVPFFPCRKSMLDSRVLEMSVDGNASPCLVNVLPTTGALGALSAAPASLVQELGHTVAHHLTVRARLISWWTNFNNFTAEEL